jgi:predicted enzyme related to lactoylglutathione lyase
MAVKSLDLCWINVTDLDKSTEFFSKVLGLKVEQVSKENGWVELQGSVGGARLGLAQSASEESWGKPSYGRNAIVTFRVDNLEKVKKDLQARNVQFVGDTIEVPGHVKMIFFNDLDGNNFQLVEML